MEVYLKKILTYLVSFVMYFLKYVTLHGENFQLFLFLSIFLFTLLVSDII